MDNFAVQDLSLSFTQLKDPQKWFIELGCRGDSGSIYMTYTMRTGLFPSQGMNTLTEANLIRNLHKFETIPPINKVLKNNDDGTFYEVKIIFATFF